MNVKGPGRPVMSSGLLEAQCFCQSVIHIVLEYILELQEHDAMS